MKQKCHLIARFFFVYQYLLLAGKAPVSGHLSPTPLVAAYENHSRKRPAPVTDIFIPSRGCPLTRALTVSVSFAIKNSVFTSKRFRPVKTLHLVFKSSSIIQSQIFYSMLFSASYYADDDALQESFLKFSF